MKNHHQSVNFENHCFRLGRSSFTVTEKYHHNILIYNKIH